MKYYVELKEYPEWTMGQMYPLLEHDAVSDAGNYVPVQFLEDSTGYVVEL